MQELVEELNSVDMESDPLQLLTFELQEETYGVNIANVREVLEYCEVTRVPRCPEFLSGVINLRGHVVPVINLSIEFGLEAQEPTVETCIIIFEFPSKENQTTLLGCIVDAVNEVVEVRQSQLGEVPNIGNQIDPGFIEAMAKLEDKFVIVLKIDQVLSQQQLLEIDNPAVTTEEVPDAQQADSESQCS